MLLPLIVRMFVLPEEMIGAPVRGKINCVERSGGFSEYGAISCQC
jgi:hypothetical protein